MIQLMIFLCGATSIWMLNTNRFRFWGAAIGLLGEPFWLYTSIKNGQWGIVVLCFWYSYAFVQGMWINRKSVR